MMMMVVVVVVVVEVQLLLVVFHSLNMNTNDNILLAQWNCLQARKWNACRQAGRQSVRLSQPSSSSLQNIVQTEATRSAKQRNSKFKFKFKFECRHLRGSSSMWHLQCNAMHHATPRHGKPCRVPCYGIATHTFLQNDGLRRLYLCNNKNLFSISISWQCE